MTGGPVVFDFITNTVTDNKGETMSTTAKPIERLLTLREFGEVTNTTERMGRRLVDQRRIRFVRVGRYVRIPESAVVEFLEAGRVEVSPHEDD